MPFAASDTVVPGPPAVVVVDTTEGAPNVHLYGLPYAE